MARDATRSRDRRCLDVLLRRGPAEDPVRDRTRRDGARRRALGPHRGMGRESIRLRPALQLEPARDLRCAVRGARRERARRLGPRRADRPSPHRRRAVVPRRRVPLAGRAARRGRLGQPAPLSRPPGRTGLHASPDGGASRARLVHALQPGSPPARRLPLPRRRSPVDRRLAESAGRAAARRGRPAASSSARRLSTRVCGRASSAGGCSTRRPTAGSAPGSGSRPRSRSS